MTEEKAPYWESARAHALRLPHCTSCERHFYPPSVRCPACLSASLEWQPVSGHGRVYSWVVMHQVYDPAFRERVPYVVAVVELEDGPRLVTNLVNCTLDRIRMAMPVRVVYEDVDEETTLVTFESDDSD